MLLFLVLLKLATLHYVFYVKFPADYPFFLNGLELKVTQSL